MVKKVNVLDLGSGSFPYRAKGNEQVTSIDFRPEVKPTIVHDLSDFPYPFEDNFFDVVYASHIMEHLPDNVRFMEEIYRIAKPGARVIVRVPHYSGRSAWGDPTHLRAYSSYQFRYYSRNRKDHYGHCDFEPVRLELRYTRLPRGFLVTRILSPMINFFANLNVRFCEKVWCYWVGGFSEIFVELNTIKDGQT